MQNKTKTTELLIETAALKNAALPFRALRHKLRIQMLQLLHKKGSMTATDILLKMRLDQAVAWQHLAILCKEGIVKTTKEGVHVYYSINYERINGLLAFAGQLVEIKQQALARVPQPKAEPPQPKIKKESWFTEVRRKVKQKGL